MGLYLSFLFLLSLSDFFASFVPCITLLMTVDIASYLINSSDTDSSFHDLDCHVCSSELEKNECNYVFGGLYLSFLNIVLGKSLLFWWLVPSFPSISFSFLFVVFILSDI